MYKGELYVVGGTPLTNDVWVGSLTTKIVPSGASAGSRYPFTDGIAASKLTMTWSQKQAHMSDFNPFSPRAGHCLVSQLRKNTWNETADTGEMTDRMFLIGGFGGWPKEDERYDGERSRNDIFVTDNGLNWTKIEPPMDEETGRQRLSMPWGARAWHGCATFHDKDHRHIDVSIAAQETYLIDEGDGDLLMHPRIFVLGGGYIGQKQNNVVRKMEGYSDLWWTRNGQDWTKVSCERSERTLTEECEMWRLTHSFPRSP